MIRSTPFASPPMCWPSTAARWRPAGPVEEMLTEELLHTLYRIPLTVAQVPVTGGTVRSCVYDPAKP